MKKLPIEYSIISPGTEREGQSEGYMAITKPNNGLRYMLAVSHDTDMADTRKTALNCYDYSIENIAISRFELIFALNAKRLYMVKKAKILLCGFGPVGFGAMLTLKRMGFQDVSIMTSKSNVCDIIEQIGAKFRVIKSAKFARYDFIIDATGNGKFLQNIIEKTKPFTNIAILGTPRKNNLINALKIHRKNLSIFGAHEINGFSQNIRNRLFHKLLKENVDIARKLCYFIKYHPFDLSLREKLTSADTKMFSINILQRRDEEQ